MRYLPGEQPEGGGLIKAGCASIGARDGPAQAGAPEGHEDTRRPAPECLHTAQREDERTVDSGEEGEEDGGGGEGSGQ